MREIQEYPIKTLGYSTLSIYEVTSEVDQFAAMLVLQSDTQTTFKTLV